MKVEIYGHKFKKKKYWVKAVQTESEEECAFYHKETMYIVNLDENIASVASTINHEFLHHILQEHVSIKASDSLDNLCDGKNACRRCIANVQERIT